MRNLSIKVLFILCILLFWLIPSTCFADSDKFEKWEEDYVSTNEEATLLVSGLPLYLDGELTRDNSLVLKKGDKIVVNQPLEVSNTDSNVIKVKVNSTNEGYVPVKRYIESSIMKSDSLDYKIYKYFLAGLQNIDIGQSAIIGIIIISLLLMIFDKTIDGLISNFVKAESEISIIHYIAPSCIFLVINYICACIDNDQYTNVLINGISIIPKAGSIMYYILYFSKILFIIFSMVIVYIMFSSYNPILAVIKLIESTFLSIVFSMIVFVLGFIALLICLGILLIRIIFARRVIYYIE